MICTLCYLYGTKYVVVANKKFRISEILDLLQTVIRISISFNYSEYSDTKHKRTCIYMHHECIVKKKNNERHTAHTIVSWPNPKQWVIIHTSDLMMIIRQSMYILSIIPKEIGKMKTHSPTYCIMDNWENMLNLTHTLDKLLSDRDFINSMSSDKVCTMMIMRWCNVQTKEYDLQSKRIRLFALIINCTILMNTNSRYSRNVYTISDRIWCNKHIMHTTTEKYENNGKGGYFRFDDDNNMNMIYPFNHIYVNGSVEHIQPHILLWK